jgi:hypothetical protein
MGSSSSTSPRPTSARRQSDFANPYPDDVDETTEAS